MVTNVGISPVEGPIADKLQELRSLLLSSTPRSNEKNGSSAAIDTTALCNLSDALFARAPLDYILKTPIEAMLEVAKETYHFYSSFIESGGPFKVDVQAIPAQSARGASTVLRTAIADRPFIIDTLTELIRRRALTRRIQLHPIVNETDGRHISLVYLEIAPSVDVSELDSLREEVESILAKLILITDDYSAMFVRAEATAHLLTIATTAAEFTSSEREEAAAFLRWLADGGFVFLGFKECLAERGKVESIREMSEESLGLFRDASSQALNKDVTREAEFLLEQNTSTIYSKVIERSPIHRSARMELFTVKVPMADANQVKIVSFIGLLTSKAIAQEAAGVPMVRKKLQDVLELEGLLPNSHNYKEILSIADGIPKSDLLQYSTQRLRKELILIFDMQRRNEIRVSAFQDPFRRFITINIVIPKERYSVDSREKIQRFVEELLSAKHDSSEFLLSVTDYPLVVLRLLITNPTLTEVRIDIPTLEDKITQFTRTWSDTLHQALDTKFQEDRLNSLCAKYAHAFPEQYRKSIEFDEIAGDVTLLEQLTKENSLEISLKRSRSESELYELRIYKLGERLTLSGTIPFLENVGFDIVSESVTPVSTDGAVTAGIYSLSVKPSELEAIDEKIVESIVVPGLKRILNGSAENDRLNRLLLSPGLNCTKIAILRALTSYLWQIKASSSPQVMISALVGHPLIAELLVEYFSIKFNPELFPEDKEANRENRSAALEALEQRFTQELKQVSRLIHDRALRSLLNVLQASVRTNFYQHPDEYRIAIKIDCQKISRMPSPRPKFEIFVTSPDFEGIHLRGGLVARGGLRWSDRKDDYRTEVLGLMKTQMVKNSIIVPVGAKGGFVVKQSPKERDELQAWVKTCYQNFIRSLLEITDNRIEDDICPPEKTLRYDDDDPYLVVAADRGTATFSDVANAIASDEFNFWLGDAFASGGSTGYDHKKYGITARGAWEAVCRHFREVGLDVEEQEFTVSGIGDMSGDVFGNGLLLSDNAKLIAAFNHRHIFIDPNPDSKTSFAERKRLFELPHSSWTDYNEALLSPGGAIYDRTLKEINLSAEAQKALGCNESVLAGEELIRAILKAPVDLHWNGGIGTYVKSHDEDNAGVGDRANDDVRVDARELRARVIGEGGNLGLTQLGRIEYSRIGGHVNMDAVDNSGGVDMSDLEVNLKILFAQSVRRGAITIEERNSILLSCAEEACEKVLNRNRSQSMVLSLAVRRSRKNIGYYRGLINALENEVNLDREKEFLPDDETLGRRSALKAGLTRPELAILVAYSKMSLYDTILKSNLPEEPFLERLLFSYFPKSIAERFREDILTHPLKREIIATTAANLVVERMGASFVYRNSEETGATSTNIIRSFLAADAIIEAETLSEELKVMDRANATRSHLVVLLRIQSAIDGMSRWILEHFDDSTPLSSFVETYSDPFRKLVRETGSLITDLEKTRFQEACRQLIVNDVPKDLANAVAASAYSTAFLDIALISNHTNFDVISVAHLYSALADALHIRKLLEQANDVEPMDHWEALALRTISADIRRSVAELAKSIVHSKNAASKDAMNDYLVEHRELVERYRHNVREFNNQPATMAALLVISNQLLALSKNGARR
jgi:glutamate dehydrogenase